MPVINSIQSELERLGMDLNALMDEYMDITGDEMEDDCVIPEAGEEIGTSAYEVFANAFSSGTTYSDTEPIITGSTYDGPIGDTGVTGNSGITGYSGMRCRDGGEVRWVYVNELETEESECSDSGLLEVAGKYNEDLNL